MSNKQFPISRRFTAEDQLAFAELSGDRNPLHLDALAARRLLFGTPVAHGINLVLWGLDAWLERVARVVEISSLKVLFLRSVPVEAEVELDGEEFSGAVKLCFRCAGAVASRLEFTLRELHGVEHDPPEDQFPNRGESRLVTEQEIPGKEGRLALCLARQAVLRSFPNLAVQLSPWQIAALLGSTRLVGMECPGLHSLYSELAFTSGGPDQSCHLAYQVAKFDERFGLVSINLRSRGLTGTLRAFLRPAPRKQAGLAELRGVVPAGEFSGQKALVIGGSRGLGEVTAKLLAAGSAEVRLTYHRGEDDARRVAAEIGAVGAPAGCFQLDVLSSDRSRLLRLLQGWRPTHVYYFATPPIFTGVQGVFSSELFNRFSACYIGGFLNIMEPLKLLAVSNYFQPSSVAVETLPPGLGEYAAAKLAGETFGQYLEPADHALRIYRPRLPGLDTDQTARLLSFTHQDPVPVMLEHLRMFQAASRTVV